MKKIFLVFVLAIFSLAFTTSSAAVITAQDVFDEVNYYLVLNYGGSSNADIRGLSDKYQPKLDLACKEKPVCPAENAYPVIQAMMEEINDAHTYFAPGAAAQLFAALSGTGSTTGFGIELRYLSRHSKLLISDVIEGSNAEKAGFQRGDWILGLNGRAYTDAYKLVQAWFAAEASKQSSSITISRQGRSVVIRLEPQTFSTRLPSLKVRDDGVAILRIPNFLVTPKVGQAIHALVLEAQAKNAKAIIVDLRDNPGGKVEDTMAGVSAFIPDGLVHRFVSKQPQFNFQWTYNLGTVESIINGQKLVTYKMTNPAKWNLPVAVLVNDQSASGSEFFSFDIQTAKRGLVIGERTAGAGNSSARFLSTSDGSLLGITINQSVRPDGSVFPAFVTPDIEVKDDLELLNRTGRDAIMEKALETLAR
jgi:carboxyl-terminal processing protease